MKVAVLGATGPTGVEVVKQALEHGYDVVALVRDPEKLATLVKHDKLKMHKVDVSKQEDLVGPLKGVDCILSCLGGQAGIWTPCTLYTDAITAITGAMRDARVKKLICISSWGAKDEPGLPRIITWFLKPTFLRNILANMAEMENFLQEKCSDINYTVVRPPGLNNNPLSGKEIITREGQFVDGASSLPRADLAKFMLSCLTSKTYDKKMIAVAVPK